MCWPVCRWAARTRAAGTRFASPAATRTRGGATSSWRCPTGAPSTCSGWTGSRLGGPTSLARSVWRRSGPLVVLGPVKEGWTGQLVRSARRDSDLLEELQRVLEAVLHPRFDDRVPRPLALG